MQKWCRLAVVLSAFWVAGLTAYAMWAWDHKQDYRAPFITAELAWEERPTRDGTELWPVTRWTFNWPVLVWAMGMGGLVSIWALVAGVPWVTAGFRHARITQSAVHAEPTAEPGGSP